MVVSQERLHGAPHTVILQVLFLTDLLSTLLYKSFKQIYAFFSALGKYLIVERLGYLAGMCLTF